MPRTILLSNGDELTVGCQHIRFTDRHNVVHRKTLAFLKQGDFLLKEVVAHCHPDDNFCKRTGRKIAATKLINDLPFPKEDRRKIFQALCPEFCTQEKES